jgi:hypothetical protein
MSKPDRPDERMHTGATLMDDSATPARYGLTKPQELPLFGTDEFERPFAMADDREDRGEKERVAGKPLTIRESKPE